MVVLLKGVVQPEVYREFVAEGWFNFSGLKEGSNNFSAYLKPCDHDQNKVPSDATRWSYFSNVCHHRHRQGLHKDW